MKQLNNQVPKLGYLSLAFASSIQYQLTPEQLVQAAVERNEGVLTDTGALAIDTGHFTGRSPKDRFIVDDHITHDTVWWGPVNFKFDGAKFNSLFGKMTAYLSTKQIFVRDCLACAKADYQLGIRVVTETAYQNLFAHHLFLRPEIADASAEPEWTIIAAPGFQADPEQDGTRQPNFTIISFSKRTVLIGGVQYINSPKDI